MYISLRRELRRNCRWHATTISISKKIIVSELHEEIYY